MKVLKIISLMLVLFTFSSVLLACNDEKEPTPSGTNSPTSTSKPTDTSTAKPKDEQSSSDTAETPSDEPSDPSVDISDPFENGLSIDGTDISEFVIVHASDAANTVLGFASDFKEWVYDVAGVKLTIVEDSTAEVEHEILVGNTNRTPRDLSLSSSNYAYKASIANGKLAVLANKRNGWKIALDSIKCSFVSGNGSLKTQELTNNKIDFQDMKSLISGAVRFEVLDDGLRAFRATAAQQTAWSGHTKGWQYNTNCPESSALVYFDFDTNSSFIDLSVMGGNLTVIVNDEFVSKDSSSYTKLGLDNGDGTKMNHLTIILPVANSNNWKITGLEISDNAIIKKHKTDLNILILGDSITEGYNNHGNPHCTYTFYTKMYFNANVLNQGNSGSQIWADLLDPELADLFDPDVIIIAIGTNDYAGGVTKSGLKSRMNTYLDKVQSIFPDAQIIGLTPIARLNEEMTEFDSNLKNAAVGLIEAFEEHGAMAVDAEDFLNHDPELYADYVHPNEKGFVVYGENLCKAIESKIADIVAAKNKK